MGFHALRAAVMSTLGGPHIRVICRRERGSSRYAYSTQSQNCGALYSPFFEANKGCQNTSYLYSRLGDSLLYPRIYTLPSCGEIEQRIGRSPND